MAFRDRLNIAINELGVTSYKISKETNIPQSTLSNYRKYKESTPSSSIVKVLANYLNVNYEWLLDGKGNMHNRNDGKNLKEILEKSGHSIKDLATELRISESETEKLFLIKELDDDLVEKISDILHIPERYINTPSKFEEETNHFKYLLDEKTKKDASVKFMLDKIEFLNREIGRLQSRIEQLEEENEKLRKQ